MSHPCPKEKTRQVISINWVMARHAMPIGSEFFDRGVAYYETVLEMVKESPDPKTAKEKMMKAYPNYGGAFLLDMMLPAFYRK